MNSVTLVLAVLASGSSGPAVDGKAAWEQMKVMAGEWQGVAGDGRKIRHTVELIAGESVLMERSWFEAHPGEMMVTMYHLDQGKLMLTHYCVAKNQPRMEATEVSGNGKTILFTFKDATNLKSRDSGHMDKASYTFVDANTFKSKWTWYQQGKEQWMEEFTFQRIKPSKTSSLNGLAKATCCAGG